MKNSVNENETIESVEESTEVLEKTKKEKENDMKTDQNINNDNHTHEETLEPESNMSENETDDQKEVEFDPSLISDSTSILETITFIQEDVGNLFGDDDLYEELRNFIDTKGKSNSKEERLEDGKKLLQRCIKQYNRSWSGVKGTFTHYAIDLGKLLITLKQLVKDCDQKWEPWAAENLPFIKDRTRQIYMRIAAIPKVEDFEVFGIERLNEIASAVKGEKSKNRISKFLRRYDLTFDPEAEDDIDEFKEKVDLALDAEKIRKGTGIKVSMKIAAKYKQNGNKIDASLFKTLKAIKESGGNPIIHLTKPVDDEMDGKKKVQSFKKLADGLKGTITWILDNEDYIKDIELDQLETLEAKLADLKERLSQPESDSDSDSDS